MYTDGEVIIERKGPEIELTTNKFTINYLFQTKKEAMEIFLILIKIYEK